MIGFCLLWFPRPATKLTQRLISFSLATVGVLCPLFLWEYGRNGEFLLWRNQINNYGGLRLAWSWELWPRLWGWSELFVLSLGGGLLLPLWSEKNSPSTDQHNQDPIWQVIILYIISYIAFHWLVAIPIWDRYLLPVVPLVALALAHRFGDGLNIRSGPVSWSILLFLILLPQAHFTRTAGFPLGGSPQADDGAAQIAQYLKQKPYGTVLYDHWYSWQWGYHLFDDKVHVSWVPHPQQLQRELQAFGNTEDARYLVLVADERAMPFATAVQELGFTLKSVAENDKMILYRLERN